MTIRLRLTLLYTVILASTLFVFGLILYTIQAQTTLNALKRDLNVAGERLSGTILWVITRPDMSTEVSPPLVPLDLLSDDPSFRGLRERVIVRVLDAKGTLITSPFGPDQESLPLSEEGLRSLSQRQSWWQTGWTSQEKVLVLNMPVFINSKFSYIVQVGRSLTERDRSLAALGTTLIVASLLTILAAFGIGWAFSGTVLRPIHRITQTAQAIGNESDFAKRVDYSGTNDEIGALAKTFNSMLSRLHEAYQRVSQALTMQRNFVADVSHELRTPLTTVHGNLALLRREPPLPESEKADILNDLVDESDRLIRLVNELLVLAYADAGQTLELEALPLQPVIDEACRQARQIDSQREILETVPDLTVMANRDALRQVLLILLDNALKYTRGSIRVTAETIDQRVVISVADEGPGLPVETLQHVFDRFYRGESSRLVPGFGLGLPIARVLVERQGGTVGMESEEGKGSIVVVRLACGGVMR